MASGAFVLICLVTGVTNAQEHAEGDVRLVNGTSQSNGVPEIYLNGDWITICDSFIRYEIGTTICNKLGFQQSYVTLHEPLYYGNWSNDIFCAERDPYLLNECRTSMLPECPDPYLLNECWTSMLPECPDQKGISCHQKTNKGPPASPGVTNAQEHAEGDVRLVNRTSQINGVPEIYLNGDWITICDSYIRYEIGMTICNKLGFQKTNVTLHEPLYYGKWSEDIFCAERDPYLLNDCWTSMLPECPDQKGISCYQKDHRFTPVSPNLDVAYKYLEGDMRMVHNKTPFDGVPQLYMDGKFTTICDVDIRPVVAVVICRQLGFPTTNITLKDSSVYDKWSFIFYCYGHQQDMLLDCIVDNPPSVDCRDQKGIICQGNLHLYAKAMPDDSCDNGYGFVYDDNGFDYDEAVYSDERCLLPAKQIQVYVNDTFIPICATQPDVAVAKVICRQMGLAGHTALSYGHFFNSLTGTFYLSCTGNEESHEQCTRHEATTPCTPENTLGVECNATAIEVMLVQAEQCEDIYSNGTVYDHRDPCYRQHGMHILYETSNGSVLCVPADNNTALNEQLVALTKVACFTSGYSRYNAGVTRVKNRYVPENWGDPGFLLEQGDILCTGHEQSVNECTRHATFGQKNCGSSYHVIHISCAMPIRLENVGSQGPSGLLLKEDDDTGEWKYLHVNNADSSLAHVICRQLGYRSISGILPGNVRHGPLRNSSEVLNADVHCTGSETFLHQCSFVDMEDTGELVDVLEIDCGDRFDVVVSQDENHTRITGIPVSLFISGNEHPVCVNKSRGVNYETIAEVLCYSHGYSRFFARPLAVPSPGNSTDARSPVHLPMQCTSKDSSITSCTLVEPIYEEPNCQTLLSITCEDPHVCQTPYDVPAPKPLKCVYHYCDFARKCDTNAPIVVTVEPMYCSMKEACSAFWRRDSTIGYNRCYETCMPEYREDIETMVCCFTDECNNKSASEYSYRGLIEIHGLDNEKTFDARGIVAIPVNGSGWLYLPAQDNYSEEFLAWICRSSGYWVWEAASFPSGPLLDDDTPRCAQIVDPVLCMENDDIGACIGSRAPCTGPVQGVNCNTRTEYLRLVDGATPFMGRVELYYNHTWGTICSDGFGHDSARVICRSLGFPGGCSRDSVSDATLRFVPGELDAHFHNVQCQGHEKNMWYCDFEMMTSSCEDGHDVGIVCAERVDGPYKPDLLSAESDVENADTAKTELTCLHGSCTDETCYQQADTIFQKCMVTDEGHCFVSKIETASGKRIIRSGCESGKCTQDTTIDQFSGKVNATYCCHGDVCFDQDMFAELVQRISAAVDILPFETSVSRGAAGHRNTTVVILISFVYLVLDHYGATFIR